MKNVIISLFIISFIFLSCCKSLKEEKIYIHQFKPNTDEYIDIEPYLKDSSKYKIYIPFKFKIGNKNIKEIYLLKIKSFTNNNWNKYTINIYDNYTNQVDNKRIKAKILSNQQSEYTIYVEYLIKTKDIRGVFETYKSLYNKGSDLPITAYEVPDIDKLKIMKYMKCDSTFYSNNKDFVNKYQMNDSIEFIFTDFYEKDTIRKKIEIENMFK